MDDQLHGVKLALYYTYFIEEFQGVFYRGLLIEPEFWSVLRTRQCA
jgi:hypothetical protein